MRPASVTVPENKHPRETEWAPRDHALLCCRAGSVYTGFWAIGAAVGMLAKGSSGQRKQCEQSL